MRRFTRKCTIPPPLGAKPAFNFKDISNSNLDISGIVTPLIISTDKSFVSLVIPLNSILTFSLQNNHWYYTFYEPTNALCFTTIMLSLFTPVISGVSAYQVQIHLFQCVYHQLIYQLNGENLLQNHVNQESSRSHEFSHT